MVYGLFGDKYVWNFVVYCRKNENTKEVACVAWKESGMVYKVILDSNLQGKEYAISINNFFTSVGLF